jgi:hypothetical protein
MGKEAERHIPFILSLADLLPQLSLHKLDVTKISPNTWSIKLVVENSGFLATYTSQQAKNRLVARPVVAELSLPEGKILAGKERSEIGHLEGRSNKDEITAAFALSATDNRGLAQWVVESRPGCELQIFVYNERGGKLSTTLKLE